MNYRKIYEDNFGPIPVDKSGRKYDIHHIDGKHANNNPCNLKAVSIQEHYDIHLNQEDWAACLLISFRLKLTATVISELAKKSRQKALDAGIRGGVSPEFARARELKKIAEGNHRFLDGDFQRVTARKRVSNGTHPFLGSGLNTRLLEAGKHHSQTEHICPVCGRKGMGNFFKGKHFQKCKNS